MDYVKQDTVIGYSVFEKFEECYQYNENACFVADSQASAQAFLENGFDDPKDCRIDAVTFADVMRDFGCSCGEYAFESQAFKVFQSVAALNAVTYDAEPDDGDFLLMVTEVDGVSRTDD